MVGLLSITQPRPVESSSGMSDAAVMSKVCLSCIKTGASGITIERLLPLNDIIHYVDGHSVSKSLCQVNAQRSLKWAYMKVKEIVKLG